MYFFCINKQNGTCDSRYVNIARVEDVVEEHYSTIEFTPDFIATTRAQLTEIMSEQKATTRLLHQQLTTQLNVLDAQETNLLDLGLTDLTSSAKAKIKTKLHEIEAQRTRLTERLHQTGEDLADGAELVEACLALLQNTQALYLRCDDEQRRMLNQALFTGLYLEDDEAVSSDLVSPFAQLHTLQTATSSTQGAKAVQGPTRKSGRSP